MPRLRAFRHHTSIRNQLPANSSHRAKRSRVAVAFWRKGDTHGPSSTRPSKPLSGLLVEGKSYAEGLYGPGCAAQAGKSSPLIRSATYGSAELAQAADSVEVDQTGAGAGTGARDLDGPLTDGLVVEA